MFCEQGPKVSKEHNEPRLLIPGESNTSNPGILYQMVPNFSSISGIFIGFKNTNDLHTARRVAALSPNLPMGGGGGGTQLPPPVLTWDLDDPHPDPPYPHMGPDLDRGYPAGYPPPPPPPAASVNRLKALPSPSFGCGR